MRPASLALIALPLFGCGRRAPHPAEFRGDGFSCDVPADWRVRESPDGAAFFGPPSGASPFSASISLKALAAGAAPEGYAALRMASASKSTPLRKTDRRGMAGFEFAVVTARPPLHGSGPGEDVRELHRLIPHKGGFLAAVHSAPASSFHETEPAFRVLLESLKLR